ncbi:type II toxin-antitoxin system RelE/ParE family toxin [Tardiphaga alba]|uniref:Type II toxin-antitoxin system RelE/ParE family toxin n=1 Tax=Tardiphaga alba TaxID=340268 RepID=A0ABX8ABT3_9BRAD|nr:type II toxin-antitoxin system RelE/ParE family toxin [Tardiphaga alba]QUS40952.1 type II toxin-antitoxin system RelE/ParE family toxin [Tardiphaga alba]
MRIIVEEEAAADLDDAIRWISHESPRAAVKMRRRIVVAINRLSNPKLTGMGRPGQIKGTRELIEHPYVIVYRVDAPTKAVIVQAIIHGARDRPSSPTSDEN